jgi:glycosyltransferase involved in cell wall biosynthesis
MRIAYLCSDLGVPVYGTKGASIHVRELSRALQELGHEVLVLCARLDGSRPDSFDVPLVEVPLEQGHLALGDRGARAAAYVETLPERMLPRLRGFAPDVLYERFALNGSAGLALAHALRIPLVIEVNAPIVDEEVAHRGLRNADGARTVEQAVLRQADRLVAVSGDLKRWLVGLGVEAERIAVVPNAVDPDRFEIRPQERDAVRRRLDVNGTPVVAFAGTLKPWHDPTILVRAVGLLRERRVATRLLIVGDGPQRPAVEELAREQNLTAAVTVTGAVAHDEVPAYLGAADVAAVTYHPETGRYFSPLKLFEYLAAGLAVVAAELGEIPHCVRAGETGLLYPPGDAEALADGLAALLADRDRAAALGRNGREHVRRHHTWAANARAVVELAEAAA